MKVLLSWLQEFAPVNGAPEEIGNQLSDLGLAVEAMTSIGGGLDGVVVARVLDLRPHPDAARSQLVQGMRLGPRRRGLWWRSHTRQCQATSKCTRTFTTKFTSKTLINLLVKYW